MQQLPNPMANMYRTQLEAARHFADAIFNGTEKLDRLVLEATHQAVIEQFNLAQAIAGGRDPASAGINVAGSFLQRNSDQGVNYQAEMIRVMAEMQTEIGKSMQEYMEQMSSQASGAATQSTQAAQQVQTASGGADTMANPMASMLGMWESAFRDATAMATRNMSTARENMERAADAGGSFARTATRGAEQATEGAAESVRKAGEAAENATTSRRKQ